MEPINYNFNQYIPNQNFNNPKQNKVSNILVICFAIFLIIILFFLINTMYKIKSDKIAPGIFIDEVRVSNLTKQDAVDLLNSFVSNHSQDELILIHADDTLDEPYEAPIYVEQIESTYDIQKAVDEAYNLNRTGNIAEDFLTTIYLMFGKKTIDLDFSCNEEILEKNLEDISKNLPDCVIQSSYYIDDSELVLTKGRTGCVVDITQMVEVIKFELSKLTYKGDKIVLLTKKEDPQVLDIEQIYYDEIKKEAKDAYFTTDPYQLFPSENGQDFEISLSDAKQLYDDANEELSINLIVVKPQITTDMLGDEAFPSVLSQSSTNYVNNANRTTNLRLAASKINGTILLPGESFSYNKVVGERTISAGYKNAAIYENGQVVDGLGGGICQVTTTLYLAVLYANLEVVDRTNHMFVPSYVSAGMDATVVYGSIDFVFKNNRDYPIKIECSVQNGKCYFKILGLSYEDDPRVEITTSVSNTSSYTYSTTYKNLYDPSGNLLSSDVISKDTYKRH